MKLAPFLPKTLPFPLQKLTLALKNRGLPILKAFWRPILLITVGAHIAILNLPQQSSAPEAELEVPVEEEIKITSLNAPKKPKSEVDKLKSEDADAKPKSKAKPEVEEEPDAKPKSKAKPEPEPEEPEEPKPREKAAPPPPPPLDEEPPEEEPVDSSTDEELEEEPPEEEPPEEEPPKEEPPEEEPPKEEPPEEEPPKKKPLKEEPPKEEEEEEEDNSEDVEAAGSGLISELRDRILRRLLAGGNEVNNAENTTRYLDSLPIGNVPESRHEYFFEGDRLKSGALSSLSIAQSSPTDAYANYIEPVLKEQLGFKEIESLEDYGGEALYKAKNEDGIEFYMSLVKLKLGAGTIVVIWPSDPNSRSGG
jgi:hypothetical protein